MSLSLTNIKPNTGATKKRKRVGRGNASGHGSFSTRGMKGQKSRSGVSGLKRLGMKKQLLAIPKKRGFKSFYDKAQVVNLQTLNEHYKTGETVNPKSLQQKGLIAKLNKKPVKILSTGELTVTGLIFANVALSAKAKEGIIKAGGIIR